MGRNHGMELKEEHMLMLMFSWMVPVMMCILGIVINGIVGGILIGMASVLLVSYIIGVYIIIKSINNEYIKISVLYKITRIEP